MANTQGIAQYLKPLSWDVNLSEGELEELFTGKQGIIRGLSIIL